MARKRIKTSICPNCATQLLHGENYCPQCGQENHDIKLPLKHFIEEFIEGIFHFDTKFWKTFSTLFTRPGMLTRDFLDGKRIRYVPPIRLYIFVSFIFFLLLGYSYKKNDLNGNLIKKGKSSLIKISNNESTEKSPVGLNINLKPAAENDTLDNDIDTLLLSNSSNKIIKFNKSFKALKQLKTDTLYAVVLRNSEKVKYITRKELEEIKTYNKQALNEYYYKNLKIGSYHHDKMGNFYFQENIINANESVNFNNTIIKNMPIAMFLIMPLFALLLQLFFRRQKKYYTEHLVFSIHIHSFTFILLSFYNLLKIIIPQYKIAINNTSIFIIFVTIIYFIMSLKNAYNVSYKNAIGKSILLFVPYITLLVTVVFLIAIQYILINY